MRCSECDPGAASYWPLWGRIWCKDWTIDPSDLWMDRHGILIEVEPNVWKWSPRLLFREPDSGFMVIACHRVDWAIPLRLCEHISRANAKPRGIQTVPGKLRVHSFSTQSLDPWMIPLDFKRSDVSNLSHLHTSVGEWRIHFAGDWFSVSPDTAQAFPSSFCHVLWSLAAK